MQTHGTWPSQGALSQQLNCLDTGIIQRVSPKLPSPSPTPITKAYLLPADHGTVRLHDDCRLLFHDERRRGLLTVTSRHSTAESHPLRGQQHPEQGEQSSNEWYGSNSSRLRPRLCSMLIGFYGTCTTRAHTDTESTFAGIDGARTGLPVLSSTITAAITVPKVALRPSPRSPATNMRERVQNHVAYDGVLVLQCHRSRVDRCLGLLVLACCRVRGIFSSAAETYLFSYAQNGEVPRQISSISLLEVTLLLF